MKIRTRYGDVIILGEGRISVEIGSPTRFEKVSIFAREAKKCLLRSNFQMLCYMSSVFFGLCLGLLAENPFGLAIGFILGNAIGLRFGTKTFKKYRDRLLHREEMVGELSFINESNIGDLLGSVRTNFNSLSKNRLKEVLQFVRKLHFEGEYVFMFSAKM